MSDEPKEDPLDDLTHDWPDDPENEDLRLLASSLLAEKPRLEPVAVDRARSRMRKAISDEHARRWMYSIVWSAFAAGFLVCVGLLSGPDTGTSNRASRDVANESIAHRVQDTYEVRLAMPLIEVPDRPLVALDRYRSLYGGPAGGPDRAHAPWRSWITIAGLRAQDESSSDAGLIDVPPSGSKELSYAWHTNP